MVAGTLEHSQSPGRKSPKTESPVIQQQTHMMYMLRMKSHRRKMYRTRSLLVLQYETPLFENSACCCNNCLYLVCDNVGVAVHRKMVGTYDTTHCLLAVAGAAPPVIALSIINSYSSVSASFREAEHQTVLARFAMLAENHTDVTCLRSACHFVHPSFHPSIHHHVLVFL